MTLAVKPLSLEQANTLVRSWHSHHKPARGHRFSLGAYDSDQMVGAVIVGNPKAQGLCDGETWEVVRLVLRRWGCASL